MLIEAWDGIPDWHEAIVRVGIDDEPRPRLVRRHSFDLLVIALCAAVPGCGPWTDVAAFGEAERA